MTPADHSPWTHIPTLGDGRPFSWTLDQAASAVAMVAHRDQKRKYSGLPYFTHCADVAAMVRGRVTLEGVAAAFLHDTKEDCGFSHQLLVDLFGERVAELVDMLTDVSRRPEDGNQKVRKAMDAEHLAGIDPEAQTIKLADLISNSRSIVAEDPGFAHTYLREKRHILRIALHQGDPELRAQAETLCDYTENQDEDR